MVIRDLLRCRIYSCTNVDRGNVLVLIEIGESTPIRRCAASTDFRQADA